MRKVDNRVRITAQLIDAATGTHVWADRYDRDLTDIFAVQDEVTREIVDALKIRLTRTAAARASPDNSLAPALILPCAAALELLVRCPTRYSSRGWSAVTRASTQSRYPESGCRDT